MFLVLVSTIINEMIEMADVEEAYGRSDECRGQHNRRDVYGDFALKTSIFV